MSVWYSSEDKTGGLNTSCFGERSRERREERETFDACGFLQRRIACCGSPLHHIVSRLIARSRLSLLPTWPRKLNKKYFCSWMRATARALDIVPRRRTLTDARTSMGNCPSPPSIFIFFFIKWTKYYQKWDKGHDYFFLTDKYFSIPLSTKENCWKLKVLNLDNNK